MSPALLLSTLWAGVVLAGFCRWRPAPVRVGGLLPERAHPSRLAVLADPRLRRWGFALLAGLVTFLVLAPAAPIAVIGGWAVPVLRARRAARAGDEAVRRALPEAVDLFTLAVGAGLTVPLAVQAVSRRHDGVLGDELARVAEQVEHGRRCADALDEAAVRLGPDARPLLAALAASERYGAPLGDGLARLSADVRADRRRRAEESARRVPVKLLFPLVICILPAFALLTVAPLLAGALGSLRL